MLTLETINRDTLWVVKMTGWRKCGTMDEIKYLAESDECRDCDLAAEQPEHLREFYEAYFEYEGKHGFTYIPDFYEIWKKDKEEQK